MSKQFYYFAKKSSASCEATQSPPSEIITTGPAELFIIISTCDMHITGLPQASTATYLVSKIYCALAHLTEPKTPPSLYYYLDIQQLQFDCSTSMHGD